MATHPSISPAVRGPARQPKQLEFAKEIPPPQACPICGAMVESRRVGSRMGWTCLASGFDHYFQARYAHLEQWFTSGEGNLREPLIQAADRAA